MAKYNALTHSFNSGELSKAGLARVDQEKVRLCAEQQENLIPYTIGKAIMRPGTEYLGTLKSSTSLSNIPPRIIPFTKSIDAKSILELTYEVDVPSTSTYYYTTIGAQSLTIPAGATSITVKAIGGGANGFYAGSTQYGGGGGAYSTNTLAVSPGSIAYIYVGNIGEDSWINVTTNAAPTTIVDGCLAKGANGNTGGQSASCVGTTSYSGGNGGVNGMGGIYSGGGPGGGGAAGPSGTGKNGGTGGQTGGYGGGGGGGGANGGSSTNGGDATASSVNGASGGQGTGGTGGGAGGVYGGSAAAAGTSGGGGGGGHGYAGVSSSGGANGGTDTSLSSVYGSGGGGGGAGVQNGAGNGGLYGGGGGGYGNVSLDPTPIGYGAQGIVVITMSFTTDQGRLRVWNSDTLVTYAAVTSSIGDMTAFTSTLTGGAVASLAVGSFTAQSSYDGGLAVIKKQITTSSAGIEHAIKITVDTGSAKFQIGSSDGYDDYLNKTTLEPGSHILSFTPLGSYWIQFTIDSSIQTSVSYCEIYNQTTTAISVPAPWSGGSLRSIRYDQSLDTMFMTIPDADPCKIERRGDRSWSVVKYQPTQGPFMVGRSDPGVRLKPAATYGNTTMASDKPFFGSYHVGSLFKLTHDSLNATFGLGAESKSTKPFRVTGVVYSGVDDRAFSVTVSGTWAGVINLQRSYDNEVSGFKNVGSNITANGTTAYAGSSNDDNAIVWYRFIFTTYTSGAATIAVSYPGWGASGVARVTAVNSTTSANIEVTTPFTNTTYTEDWLESEWNSRRGFPTAVALFDGRLWWARRDRFWGSESDSYYSYNLDVEGDAVSIQRDVATGGTMSEIRWLLPLQRLVFGTAGAEASARSSSLDEPLKANAITVKDGSTQGASDVTPLKVDGRGLFVQRSGRRLMELKFGVENNDYSAIDLTRYNETIGTSLKGVRVANLVTKDIVELAAQRHPDTYIYCLRDDGVIPALIYNPNQEVVGWFRILLGSSSTSFSSYLQHDKAVSIAVLPDEVEDTVYLVVQRRTASDTYYYSLEKIAQHQLTVNNVLEDVKTSDINTYNGLYQVDSFETSVINADGTTVTVPARFEGCSVMAIGPIYNGATLTGYGPISEPQAIDSSLTLTLSSLDFNRIGATVTVGFPYYGRYKSAKLAYGAQQGTALLQKKRVPLVGLVLSDYNQRGVRVGPDFTTLDDLPMIEEGVPVTLDSTLIDSFDGDMFPFPGEWDTDARVCVEVQPGYSATLHGLVIEVETNEH